ncbi:hypothetical protein OG985_49590 (plasmid) [Streptomyces sp. NBC_00289]|uniref:hypothetical protein n=1 Tax=Streptomyces sp. NBC_00289 TaxID=2975703 RepID=UPI002F9095CB
MKDPYEVAGHNLRAFVADWLEGLEDPSNVLLVEAARESDPIEACSYGAAYVMSNIAPKVWGENGSEKELLLFAAISVYQDSKPSGWTNCATFVEAAFGYLHTISEAEAAQQLRQWVERRGSEEHRQGRREMYEALGRPLDADPARTAAQDRELAQADHRALRAAAVLDPAGNVAPWNR